MINLFRKSKTKNKSGAGFTIIELIVVLAIIAMLLSIGITRFSSTQQKSRDVRRISDIQEIKKALNPYQLEETSFPIEPTEITITGEGEFSTTLEAAGVISAVPVDPQHPGLFYTYQSNSSGSDYDLKFCLETSTIANYLQGCDNVISP